MPGRWIVTEGMPAQGLAWGTGPAAERYLNNIQETPPDELLTEIAIPIDG